MPEMNVGDKVRCINDHLGEFFKKGEIYTVEFSEIVWPDGFSHINQYGERINTGKAVKKFSFLEVPGYFWICDFLFEDVIE